MNRLAGLLRPQRVRNATTVQEWSSVYTDRNSLSEEELKILENALVIRVDRLKREIQEMQTHIVQKRLRGLNSLILLNKLGREWEKSNRLLLEVTTQRNTHLAMKLLHSSY